MSVLEWAAVAALQVFAVAILFTPLLGVAVLRGWRWDWQCWWVLGCVTVGVPTVILSQSFFPILLLANVALLLERQRRGLPTPFQWRARLVQAVVGTGVFMGMGFASLAMTASFHGWRWCPNGGSSSPLQWAGLLGAAAVIVALRFRLRREQQAHAPQSDRRLELFRRVAIGLGGGLALACLVAFLAIPWQVIHTDGPEMLADLRFRRFALYVTETCIRPSPHALAMTALEVLAGTTLLLWGFSQFWDRVTRDTPTMAPGPGAGEPNKAR